ncbi:MAG: hypothetical protein HYX79_07385 [Chloroflexi bacterium]|nr:hypothetical protein [Chloroflexota bacterium]
MDGWFRTHKKQIFAHGIVLGSFLLYLLFLAEPLFDRFEALPDEAKPEQVQLLSETNDVRFNLDRVVVSKTALEIQGWAIIEGKSAENNRTFVVLKSNKKTYVFNTSAVFDNSVTEGYGGPDLNLDWSGFTTTIPIRKIERGDYVIGLYIARDDTAALQYSGTVIIKSSNGVKQAELLSGTILPSTNPTNSINSQQVFLHPSEG